MPPSWRRFRARAPGVDPQRHGRCASTRQPRRAAARAIQRAMAQKQCRVTLDVERASRVVAKQGLSGSMRTSPGRHLRAFLTGSMS